MPGLDPGVVAVRALAGPADADPACDVPGIDARGARHRDRRADAVTTVRRLVPCIRVSAVERAVRRCRPRRPVRSVEAPTSAARPTRTDDDREEGRTRTRVSSAAAHVPDAIPRLGSGTSAARCQSRDSSAYNAARWRRPRTAARPSRSTPGARTSTSGRRSAPTSSSRRSRGSRTSRSRPRRASRSTTPATWGYPGEYPFTRGVYPSMYRGRLWTMRQFAGFGTRGRDERALPLPARARADRAFDRVRHADAHGLRLRPPALARRGRSGGRRGRLARRHGDALRRHPARRRLDLDDDQLAGRDRARVLRLRRRAAGRPARPSSAAPRRTTSSRSTSRRRSGSSRPSRPCGSSST